jgi:hypothetical protein
MSIARAMLAPHVTSQVKSAVLATVIALLVWVFAEGESLASRTVTVAVQFPPDATPDLLIQPDDPNFRGEARVRIEGTLRSLETAAGEIGALLRLAPGSPGVPSQPGEKLVVDLREAVGSLEGLRGLGASVVDVEPKQVIVRAVRLSTRRVPVRPALGPGLDDRDAAVTPAQVTLRLPEADLPRVPAELEARPLDPDPQNPARPRPEGLQTVPAQVVIPPALAGVRPLTISPETVSISYRPGRRTETLRLPSVPVWYSLPPTEDAARWSITIEDKFLSDVALAGPPEEIARIAAGKLPVKALIELSTEDLERGAATKPALFPALPPGVTATPRDPAVRVKVARRDAPQRP